MVIRQSSPLVIITKDREEVHSVFIVKERSGPDFNHWPYQCDWLKTILDDWHAHMNGTGHQNQSQNLYS